MNSDQFRKNPSYHRIEFKQTLIQLKPLRFPIHIVHIIGLLISIIHRIVHDEIIALSLLFIPPKILTFPARPVCFPDFSVSFRSRVRFLAGALVVVSFRFRFVELGQFVAK